MEQSAQGLCYEKPELVDYGTLTELTAGHDGHHEDGLGKSHDPHPSHPHR